MKTKFVWRILSGGKKIFDEPVLTKEQDSVLNKMKELDKCFFVKTRRVGASMIQAKYIYDLVQNDKLDILHISRASDWFFDMMSKSLDIEKVRVDVESASVGSQLRMIRVKGGSKIASAHRSIYERSYGGRDFPLSLIGFADVVIIDEVELHMLLDLIKLYSKGLSKLHIFSGETNITYNMLSGFDYVGGMLGKEMYEKLT